MIERMYLQRQEVGSEGREAGGIKMHVGRIAIGLRSHWVERS